MLKNLSWKWIFPIIIIPTIIGGMINHSRCGGLTGKDLEICRAYYENIPPSPTQPSSTPVSCYSDWNGVHKEGQKVLKGLLKDPTSYEYTETLVGGNLVKIKFLAKNSYGAKSRSEFTFKTDSACSVMDYSLTK